MIARTVIAVALTVGIAGAPFRAQAQPAGKGLPRIGFLSSTDVGNTVAFRQGLRELGYVEGQNIALDHQHGADGETVGAAQGSAPEARACRGAAQPRQPHRHQPGQEPRSSDPPAGRPAQLLEAKSAEDLERAFAAAARGRADALMALPDQLFSLRPEAGSLMSYGPSVPEIYRRAATYVDKILKGARPADLPIEEPTKFLFAINLKTAKALGLRIPQSLVLRADQVIQ